MKIEFSESLNIEHPFFKNDFQTTILQKFNTLINDGKHGFFHLTSEGRYLEACKKVHNEFKNKKYFIHVGIGGSALGPQMLYSALENNSSVQLSFINNIDPDDTASVLKKINVKESLFHIVSKSGGTAETISALILIIDLLKKNRIEECEFKNYLVFTTDPVKSELKELSKKWDIKTLEIPSNVGGRFSVLTAVGFLPLLFCGIDCDSLLKGANELKSEILENNVTKNQSIQLASYLAYLLKEKNVYETVLMPYSSKLKDFSAWFVQLWAESTGKQFNTKKEKIYTGFTPIASYGATDQHSQMQLFMEGPYNKCILFIEVKKFQNSLSLANDLSDFSSFKKLSKYSMNELMQAEFMGTLKALKGNNRPYVRVTIPEVNGESLGKLILFFESLTAMIGFYLDVDCFDQPGVEAGKIYAYEYLDNLK
ncbi:MAG: hypothetical protein U0T83_00910 [Bacteriovoracaceae bacterium]